MPPHTEPAHSTQHSAGWVPPPVPRGGTPAEGRDPPVSPIPQEGDAGPLTVCWVLSAGAYFTTFRRKYFCFLPTRRIIPSFVFTTSFRSVIFWPSSSTPPCSISRLASLFDGGIFVSMTRSTTPISAGTSRSGMSLGTSPLENLLSHSCAAASALPGW